LSPKRKGAALGPRLCFPKVLPYVSIIACRRGGKRHAMRNYFAIAFSNLDAIVPLRAIDNIFELGGTVRDFISVMPPAAPGTAARASPQNTPTIPRTGLPVPSEDRSRSRARSQSRFQSQGKQRCTRDTSATAPGCRREQSILRTRPRTRPQSRGNAAPASAEANRRWRSALRSFRDSIRLKKLHSISRRMLRAARRCRFLRLDILHLRVDGIALSISIVMPNPRHSES
jgi:hypothetical protein